MVVDATMSDARKSGRLRLFLFLFLLGSFAWFFHTGQDNENARFDQIRAVVEEGSWNIDQFSGNTADVIKIDGHRFPNKAPGTTFLALPSWIFFRVLLSALPLSELVQLQFVIYLVVLSTVGIFSALAGCALFTFLQRLGLSPPAALFFAILYSLGTIAFPFSTVFFSHQLAASFLFLGFYLLWKSRGENESYLEIVFAGLLLGFAPVLEYPAALGTLIIGLYGLTSIRWRAFWIFAAAGIAAASLLLVYNWTAFHRLFFISYEAYNAPGAAFPGHQQGFVGVSWPRWDVFWRITFGRQRGLFYVNPWLVLTLPALVTLRHRTWRRELIVCFAMVVSFFVFDSGFGDSVIYWGGAWSVGPRHLIPMLPFMVVPIALLCRNRIFVGIAAVLGGFSLLTMFCATAVTPRVSYDTSDPVLFYLREIFLGRLSLNVDSIFANRFVPGFSFNLGQLLGLPPRAQLLPLGVAWAVILPLLFRKAYSLAQTRPSKIVRNTPLLFSGAMVVFCVLPVLWNPYWIDRPGWSHGLAGALAPNSVRRDAAIDFDWDRVANPAPFRGTWTGQIYAPNAGFYRFAIRSDGGATLALDGLPVSGNGLALTKGFHSVEIHYQRRARAGMLRFLWGPPDEPMEIVPPEFLFSR